MAEFVPFFVIGGLVLLYVGSYVWNKRTKIPESALSEEEQATCNACNNFSCSHHGGDA